jgi:hypothetical protein
MDMAGKAWIGERVQQLLLFFKGPNEIKLVKEVLSCYEKNAF